MNIFRNMRVRNKILFLVAVLLCLIALVGYNGIDKMDTIDVLADTMYRNDLRGLNEIMDANLHLQYMVREQKGFLLASSETERREYRERFERNRQGMQESLDAAEGRFRSSEAKQVIAELKEALRQSEEINARIFELGARESLTERRESVTLTQGQAQQILSRIEEHVDWLVTRKVNNGKVAAETIETTYRHGRLITIVLIASSLLIGLVLGMIVAGLISKPLGKGVDFARRVADGELEYTLAIDQKDEVGILAQAMNKMVANLKDKIAEADGKSREAAAEAEKARRAMQEAEAARKQAENAKREGMLLAASHLEEIVERLTSASEELAAQVEQSSHGAEQQKARVSETATAMEEMNATVLEVARNASTAADSSDSARKRAQDGAEVVSQVVSAIGEVHEQSMVLNRNMLSLGQQAEDIGKIMNVISDIADQTNLLALNAAIEAARAGEAGRGFAVVADEVRKLAEKTMTATKEVGQAISAIQQGTRANMDSVNGAVQTIEKVTHLAQTSGGALREIVSLVDQATDQVRSIATASEQQSSASEEINKAIEEINTISGETADAMTQSARAVSDLAGQSQTLQTLIQRMKSEGV